MGEYVLIKELIQRGKHVLIKELRIVKVDIYSITQTCYYHGNDDEKGRTRS